MIKLFILFILAKSVFAGGIDMVAITIGITALFLPFLFAVIPGIMFIQYWKKKKKKEAIISISVTLLLIILGVIILQRS